MFKSMTSNTAITKLDVLEQVASLQPFSINLCFSSWVPLALRYGYAILTLQLVSSAFALIASFKAL